MMGPGTCRRQTGRPSDTWRGAAKRNGNPPVPRVSLVDGPLLNMLLNSVDCISENFHVSENSVRVPNALRYLGISRFLVCTLSSGSP